MAGKQVPPRSVSLEDGMVSLSVREAARVLGVSACSVYGYLARGRLTKYSIDERIMLRENEVLALKRRTPGRTRKIPPEQRPRRLLTMIVTVRPGYSELLETRLVEFYEQDKHKIPGTFMQYIARSENDPGRLVIVLIWGNDSLPPEDQRQQALAALIADLEEVCDWTTARMNESEFLFYERQDPA